MTISEFWNQAFLATLSRLPVLKAKAEADKATEICIRHWQENFPDLCPVPTHRKDQDITLVYSPNLRRAKGK